MDYNQPPSLGSIGAPAFLWIPPLLAIVAEWAALIPLIVHLVSAQGDHRMMGDVALRGRFALGLFPKLGQLRCIARLLRDGPDFLDRVSSKGSLGSTVWDVSWGSVFPCANGAARSLLTDHALRNAAPIVDVGSWTQKYPSSISHQPGSPPESPTSSTEEKSPAAAKRPSSTATTSTSTSTSRPLVSKTSSVDSKSPAPGAFVRPQVLHILDLSRVESQPSIRNKLYRLLSSPVLQFLVHLALIGLAILLILFGCYGTAFIVLSSSVSRLMCYLIPIRRPTGYMCNNESHSGCMLAAIHENACTWFLYTGDRAVVDWLLNKTMISIDTTQSSGWLYTYFRFANYLQLLAMTFIAAQKGWDGVCLLTLMIITWISKPIFSSHESAARWMWKENIKCSARSFRFTGRTSMIGAVQLLGEKLNRKRLDSNANWGNSWMDGIIAPSPRRQVWTNRLTQIAAGTEWSEAEGQELSECDKHWVENTTERTLEAVMCIEIETAAGVGETAC